MKIKGIGTSYFYADHTIRRYGLGLTMEIENGKIIFGVEKTKKIIVGVKPDGKFVVKRKKQRIKFTYLTRMWWSPQKIWNEIYSEEDMKIYSPVVYIYNALTNIKNLIGTFINFTGGI